MGLIGRILQWGLGNDSAEPLPDEPYQVAEDLWVLPCGAYIESKKKPRCCPLCAKGDTNHFNALIPDPDEKA